jgi:hypothetical protein
MMQSCDARKGRSCSIDATEVDRCDGDDGSNGVCVIQQCMNPNNWNKKN